MNTAETSSRAFRTKSAASSSGSGPREDTALPQGLVNHRALHPSPLLNVVSIDNDEVDRDSEPSQSLPQADELRAPTPHLGLNHKQVEIAVMLSVTSGMRAKQDHASIAASSIRQSPTSLLDYRLVNHRADKVARRAESPVRGELLAQRNVDGRSGRHDQTRLGSLLDDPAGSRGDAPALSDFADSAVGFGELPLGGF